MRQKYTLIFSLLLSLCACKPTPKADLVVGTIAGPETELVKVAKEEVKQKYGMEVKIIEFNDYQLPNEALADGSLDINIYQHQPFLNASIRARAYPIMAIAKTFIYPMGMYSQHLKKLDELKNGAVIAIPNDPSNETRALKLLEQAKLIQCATKDILTPQDVQKNPLKLSFKELDAAQLPRILPDVTAAIINTTFAIPAGLNPQQDAILVETKDSPYANLIVVKIQDKQALKIKRFIKAMHSQGVRDKAKELFGWGAIAAW
jgi:D-methionine transport system substrate-binding protein